MKNRVNVLLKKVPTRLQKNYLVTRYFTASFDDWFILCGACALSTVAGYVNAVMLNYYFIPLSHMTGASSRIAMDIGHANFADVTMIGSIMLGFLFGAILSSVIIGSNGEVRAGRRYGVALSLEGLLLFLVAYLAIHQQVNIALPLASLACGLQNGMASSYKGLVIRTTHVTGTVTDIGMMIGQRLRGKTISNWKLWFLSCLWMTFIFGGIVGTLLYLKFSVTAIYLPACLCLVSGVIYALIMHYLRILSKKTPRVNVH